MMSWRREEGGTEREAEGDGENEVAKNNDCIDPELVEGIFLSFIPRTSEISIMTVPIESEDTAAMDAARSLLMLHTPDEDALTELEEHDPAEKHTDAAPISIDAALETLNSLLQGGKRNAPQHPTQLAPLMILRNFFILREKGSGAMEASQKVANMWRPGQLARRIRFLSRYYLKFQTVPVETRGGMRASTSLIYVAEVQKLYKSLNNQLSNGNSSFQR
jgi:hypothetical protein